MAGNLAPSQLPRVVDGLIVIGGCLKKPWALPASADGRCELALSSNNYSLALFLFGAVNMQRGRAFLQEGNACRFIRRVWKARNEEQNSLWARIAESMQAEDDDDDDASVPKQSSRASQKNASPKKDPSMWEMVPAWFPVEVESLARPGRRLRFEVHKDHPHCKVNITVTEAVLQCLFEEMRVTEPVAQEEGAGSAAEGSDFRRSEEEVESTSLGAQGSHDGFSSPPRRKRKRLSPYGASPGAGSSPSAAPATGKKLPSTSPGVWLMKKSRRVACRFRCKDGTRGTKYFPVEDVGNEALVAAAKAAAQEYVHSNHHAAETD